MPCWDAQWNLLTTGINASWPEPDQLHCLMAYLYALYGNFSWIHLFDQPSSYPCTYHCIHSLTHPSSIHPPTIPPPINPLSIHLSIYHLSIHSAIIYLFIHLSTHLSIIYLFIHLLTHLFIILSIHPFIHRLSIIHPPTIHHPFVIGLPPIFSFLAGEAHT